MKSLFISLDLGTSSSGNIVSQQELKALKSLGEVIEIGHNDIDPARYNLPSEIPFLVDYLAMNYIANLDLDNINLAHFYGGPYSLSIKYLKAKNIVVSLTVDAHDRQESINEAHNLGYKFPYQHILDDRLWSIYNSQVREADIIIAPSKLSADFLKKGGAKDIRRISHGVDIPPADDIKPINENQFKVGYLGAMGFDKGVRYLIESWSSLDYKDSELLLGGANATKDLEPFIRRFSTSGQFRLLGYVNDIKDFYNSLSVYVQPSVTEGWGIEVAEAMSYRRPVIVSKGAGASDCITDGKDGFIVPKRDPKSIKDKIQYFKDNPNEIIRMGKNARERSLQYNWESIRKNYIDLWKSL